MQEEIKIIFEDENILAVDKPSGLVVHSDGRTIEPSLVDFLKENYSELENIGNPHTLDSERYHARWGILNRLDRDTSGVILIAKDLKSFLNLQQQFLDHTVNKEYLAKTWGKVPGSQYITEPISRHKKDPRIWVCGTGVGERQTKRSAETRMEFVNYSETKNMSLVRLYPKTGRTHQLRLHMRFIGHPIVGDTKYGISGIVNEHGTEQIKKVLGELTNKDLEVEKKSRLMLHAKCLEFIHPELGVRIKIESEYSF